MPLNGRRQSGLSEAIYFSALSEEVAVNQGETCGVCSGVAVDTFLCALVDEKRGGCGGYRPPECENYASGER